ncbi:MAG: GIDE domain-containing protein [Candidatus Lernaella stagnicola]|nr:GIDE domain-containing protein [Candidatus Lernaella stagnicola]
MNEQAVLFRKAPLSEDDLVARAKRLHERFGLALYQTRLALSGQGLGMLRPGDAAQVEALAADMRDLGYQTALVPNERPRRQADLVRRFTAYEDRIDFEGHFETRSLRKGARLIVVLAATEPALISKLMLRSVYTGGRKPRIAEVEKRDAIFRAGPTLDIYELDADSGLPILRIMPGRFDASSLGEAATASAVENFRRVLRLLDDFAGELIVETDFGLFQLPHCIFDTAGGPEARENNLANALAYGAYVCALQQQDPSSAKVSRSVFGADDSEGKTREAVAQAAELAGVVDSFLPPPPPIAPLAWWRTFQVWHVFAVGFYSLWFLGFPLLTRVARSGVADTLFHWGWQRGLFFVASTAILIHLSFFFLRRKRLMDNTPTSKARSMAMGFVEMKGTAWRRFNLISPISQTPCVFYRVRRYEKRSGRHGEDYWVPVSVKESGSVPFELRDETGAVTIDPRGAKVKASHKRSSMGEMDVFLGSGASMESDVKHVEEIIPEGTSVYVLGFAEPGETEKPDLRRRVLEKLRFLKQNKNKLMEFDANRDDRIDEHEWDQARAAVHDEVYRDTVEASLAEGGAGPQAVIRKPPAGLPFVIAEKSEETMTTIYGFSAVGFLALAIGSLATGLVLLLG